MSRPALNSNLCSIRHDTLTRYRLRVRHAVRLPPQAWLPGVAQAIVPDAPGVVLVRDTKDRGGAVLAFGPAAWRAFGANLKHR